MISEKYDFIYFAGDSFTHAIGQLDDVHKEINKKNRFSGLICEHYNLPEVNVGLPGCSVRHIFRTIYNDVYKFVAEGKKFLAVISYPARDRMELFHKQSNTMAVLSENFDLYKDYILESYNQDYCDLISQEHIWAIHTLLDRFNIDYVEAWTCDSFLEIPYFKKERFLEKNFLEIIDKDGHFHSENIYGHANILGNRRIADYYIKKIDELYGPR